MPSWPVRLQPAREPEPNDSWLEKHPLRLERSMLCSQDELSFDLKPILELIGKDPRQCPSCRCDF